MIRAWIDFLCLLGKKEPLPSGCTAWSLGNTVLNFLQFAHRSPGLKSGLTLRHLLENTRLVYLYVSKHRVNDATRLLRTFAICCRLAHSTDQADVYEQAAERPHQHFVQHYMSHLDQPTRRLVMRAHGISEYGWWGLPKMTAENLELLALVLFVLNHNSDLELIRRTQFCHFHAATSVSYIDLQRQQWRYGQFAVRIGPLFFAVLTKLYSFHVELGLSHCYVFSRYGPGGLSLEQICELFRMAFKLPKPLDAGADPVTPLRKSWRELVIVEGAVTDRQLQRMLQKAERVLSETEAATATTTNIEPIASKETTGDETVAAEDGAANEEESPKRKPRRKKKKSGKTKVESSPPLPSSPRQILPVIPVALVTLTVDPSTTTQVNLLPFLNTRRPLTPPERTILTHTKHPSHQMRFWTDYLESIQSPSSRIRLQARTYYLVLECLHELRMNVDEMRAVTVLRSTIIRTADRVTPYIDLIKRHYRKDPQTLASTLPEGMDQRIRDLLELRSNGGGGGSNTVIPLLFTASEHEAGAVYPNLSAPEMARLVVEAFQMSGMTAPLFLLCTHADRASMVQVERWDDERQNTACDDEEDDDDEELSDVSSTPSPTTTSSPTTPPEGMRQQQQRKRHRESSVADSTTFASSSSSSSSNKVESPPARGSHRVLRFEPPLPPPILGPMATPPTVFTNDVGIQRQLIPPQEEEEPRVQFTHTEAMVTTTTATTTAEELQTIPFRFLLPCTGNDDGVPLPPLFDTDSFAETWD